MLRIFAAFAVLSFLSACGQPNGEAMDDGKIEVGVIVGCQNQGLDRELAGKIPREYAVGLWHHPEGMTACPVSVDVVLYDQDGGKRIFFNQSSDSVRLMRIPRNLITAGVLLCAEVRGQRILHAPIVGHYKKGDEDIYTTCAKNFYDSVQAGRSTGRKCDGFRIPVVLATSQKSWPLLKQEFCSH